MKGALNIERRKDSTHKVLVRIAEERIRRFNLKDTPEEYIKKTISQSFLKQ